MDAQADVINIVQRVLDPGGRSSSTFGPETPLLGVVPELDSMAVANLIMSLEEHFGFVIEDDEIDGSMFTNVGSLIAFVNVKLAV